MAERDVLERIDRTLDRIDRHMIRGNDLMERHAEAVEHHSAEFQRNREVQKALLARSRKDHKQEMQELRDLGAFMRQQTEALKRMNERLGPG